MGFAPISPFFSICIPVYNGEKFIRTAIDSVLAQTLTDWELIIVDDASIDRTWEILQEYGNHPQIQLFRNSRNLGQGGTFNRLLRQARGKWMSLLAADDYYVPSALCMVQSISEQRSDIILWIGDHRNFGDSIVPHVVHVYSEKREFTSPQFCELLYLRGGIFGGISSFAFRRDIYANTCHHHFPENTTHIDGDFWMRLMRANPTAHVLYVPEVWVHVLLHADSTSIEDEHSGRHVTEMFHAIEISIDLDWRPTVLLHQMARILWINIKFFRVLPQDQKFRCLPTIWQLLRAVLRSPSHGFQGSD